MDQRKIENGAQVAPPQGPRVVRLPANTAGRDFIVGDIHGAFDLVWDAMRRVGFKRDCDRLFCLGDLVDRGSGSHRVLEFLAQPYVHSVRGNHDDDFAQLTLEEVKLLARANWNGLKWALEVPDDKLVTIGARLRQLPIVIEVQTPRGLVGLVHANVPKQMPWRIFVGLVEQGDEDLISYALRSRERVKENWTHGVEGVGRVYIGHTINWEGGPRQLGNVFALDTGGIYGMQEKNEPDATTPLGSLTVASMICRTSQLVGKEREPDNLALRVCLHDESGAPYPFNASAPVGPPPARRSRAERYSS